MKHLKYLSYVLRHKYYVFIECCKMGIPWRGLMHDISKFRPSEWFPYANHFYGSGAFKDLKTRDKTGYYKPTDTGDPAFDHAWFLHQKRNQHHWQWWVMPEDTLGVKILPMPNKARLEMVADWKGAGRAQGKPHTKLWWDTNKDKLQLHPETRKWVEDFLDKDGVELN